MEIFNKIKIILITKEKIKFIFLLVYAFINSLLELLSIGLDYGWTYNMASIFFNFGTEGAGETYYFDDDTSFPGMGLTWGRARAIFMYGSSHLLKPFLTFLLKTCNKRVHKSPFHFSPIVLLYYIYSIFYTLSLRNDKSFFFHCSRKPFSKRIVVVNN